MVDDCAALMMDTVPAVMRLIRAEMRSHRAPDLSVPQFRALLYVSRHVGVSMSEVAEHLGLTPPTTSKLVDKLVARGLMTRTSASDDRRRLNLALTPDGQAVLHAASEATQARLTEELAALSPDECAVVSEAMHLLRRAFSPERETR